MYTVSVRDLDTDEAAREALVRIESDSSGVLVFDEDRHTGFNELCNRLIALLDERNLFEEYDFWYDGCNYAGEDYIKWRPVALKENPRGGSCWASAPWKPKTPSPQRNNKQTE